MTAELLPPLLHFFIADYVMKRLLYLISTTGSFRPYDSAIVSSTACFKFEYLLYSPLCVLVLQPSMK